MNNNTRIVCIMYAVLQFLRNDWKEDFLYEKVTVDVVYAFAEDIDKSDVAPDYQELLGGGNASVELTDRTVMAAVANLKVYPKLNGVMLPSGLKNYFVIRTGKEQAFLIMPHYKRTRITVRKAATGKAEGSLKGEMEGRSLVLFCNKGDAMIDMLG